jgi:hypothetical protein
MVKNGSKNGKIWQNIDMPFIAKINRLQGAENLPYKEYYPHTQNATQTVFRALQSITKQKAIDKTQTENENTNGERQKTLYKLRSRPPHIFAHAHKKKKPHRAKKTPCKEKRKAAHDPKTVNGIF